MVDAAVLSLTDYLEESGVGGVDDPLSGHGQPSDAVQGGHPGLQLVDVVPVHEAASGSLGLPAVISQILTSTLPESSAHYGRG